MTNFEVEPASATPDPTSDAAWIYVISQSQGGLCTRCDLTKKIGMDGKWLGAVKGESYLKVPISPGDHHLCANWQSHLKGSSYRVALHGFTAEAGKTYYLRVNELLDRAEGGGTYDKIDLNPINADEAKMLIEVSTAVTGRVK